jgi:hypothetical protein
MSLAGDLARKLQTASRQGRLSPDTVGHLRQEIRRAGHDPERPAIQQMLREEAVRLAREAKFLLDLANALEPPGAEIGQ